MTIKVTGTHGIWSLPDGATTIGRGRECEICVVDPRLSRTHARIHVSGNLVAVEDLGSTNGVLVNGDRINGRKDIENGDMIVVGPCILTLTIDQRTPNSKQVERISVTSPGTTSALLTDGAEAVAVPGFSHPTPPPQAAQVPKAPSGQRNVDPGIAAVLSSRPDLPPPPMKPLLGKETGSDRFTPMEFQVLGREDHPDKAKPPSGEQKTVTETLRPGDYMVKTTSALAAGHKLTTTPVQPRPAPPPRPTSTSGPQSIESSSLMPNDVRKSLVGAALQANPHLGDAAKIRARRLYAGFLDSAQTFLIANVVSLPIAGYGYGKALHKAGAALVNGLPELGLGADHKVASARELMLSLLNFGGVDRAFQMLTELQARDQGAFLLLFCTFTIAILFFVLIHLLGSVAATVLKGAPMWHRQFRLVIVNNRTGLYLGWGQAIARWALYAFLWPLALIAIPLMKTSPHDKITGCQVRAKN